MWLQLKRHLTRFEGASFERVRVYIKNIIVNLQSMFRFNRNKKKTNRNSLIESIFWHFSENLGLFRFVSVWFKTVLFVLVVSIKVRNTETYRNCSSWFHETNRNTAETDLVSVCFNSNRIFFSFRGHPITRRLLTIIIISGLQWPSFIIAFVIGTGRVPEWSRKWRGLGKNTRWNVVLSCRNHSVTFTHGDCWWRAHNQHKKCNGLTWVKADVCWRSHIFIYLF